MRHFWIRIVFWGIPFLGFLGSSPVVGFSQCPGSVSIRPVNFEWAGTGLEQYWEFNDPEGTAVRVQVDHAYWIGENELFIWGQREEDDPRLGLFLLRRKENFGQASWECTWATGLAAEPLGEFRNLIPVSVSESGKYRLLALDVQDETSLGMLLVVFKEGRLQRERFLPLVRLDAEAGNWVSGCPQVDTSGTVRFVADVYRLGWDDGTRVYAGVDVWLPLAADSVKANPPYTTRRGLGFGYRLAPQGNVVLASGTKVPSTKRLREFAVEISEQEKWKEVRIFRNEAALGAWYLSQLDEEADAEIWKQGLLGEFMF